MESSDVELVKQCLDGQNEAFDILVRRYQKAMYGFCIRMLGNAEDALDAAQDIFLKAYYSLEGFRSEARFSSWLFGIANNACIDRLRRRSRHPTIPIEGGSDEIGERSSGGLTPEEELMKRESERSILESLSCLSEVQRSTLLLFHLSGLSIKEVSRALGRPEGTVKYDLHEAREKLRERMKGLAVR